MEPKPSVAELEQDVGQRFELLFTCPTPLHETQCAVALDERYQRKAHDPTEHRTEELWHAKLASNARVFNGTKFRLAGWNCRQCACADAAGVDTQVLLQLGLTDYREYVGTNLRPRSELAELKEAGRAQHGGDSNAFLSNALGVETVLITADGMMVLLQRSGAVATHTGLYNGPSGHPEPSHVPGGVDLAQPMQTQVSSGSLANLVLREIFDSVRQETHEETNIPLSSLDQPLLIGAVAELPASKPDLLFVSHTSLLAKEVVECFRHGAPDAWESENMILVDATSRDAVQRLLDMDDSSESTTSISGASRHVALTPVTTACLICYLRTRDSTDQRFDASYSKRRTD